VKAGVIMTIDILAIGAHPDDAEVGCAGFLLKAQARGLKTGIVVLTHGEMGTFGNQEDRVAEARAAAEILGVNEFRILGWPDAAVETDYENALHIAQILKELRPRLVLTPHFDDRHPDHAAVPRLVERSAYLATRPQLLPEHEPLIPQPQHITFSLSFPRPCPPSFVLDISDVYGVKQEALQAHGSQYTPILFAVEIAARYYGMIILAAYGEGFIHREPLVLNGNLAII
jgi:bacillithiol biosynthesis deacetylase BshB1